MSAASALLLSPIGCSLLSLVHGQELQGGDPRPTEHPSSKYDKDLVLEEFLRLKLCLFLFCSAEFKPRAAHSRPMVCH